MNKSEVDNLLKALDEKHRKDREAILRVQQLLAESASGVDLNGNGHAASEKRTKISAKPNFSKAVREAVDAIKGPFSTHVVRDHLKAALPDVEVEKKMASISSILIGLAGAGEIKLIEKGVGAKPSMYER